MTASHPAPSPWPCYVQLQGMDLPQFMFVMEELIYVYNERKIASWRADGFAC